MLTSESLSTSRIWSLRLEVSPRNKPCRDDMIDRSLLYRSFKQIYMAHSFSTLLLGFRGRIYIPLSGMLASPPDMSPVPVLDNEGRTKPSPCG